MDERSAKIESRFEIPMLIAAILVIPLLIVEQQAHSDNWKTVATVGGWIVWSAFAVEAVVMLAVVPRRWDWIRTHPLELAVIALTVPTLPPTLRALRALRAFRLLRLLRLALLARRARVLLSADGLGYAALLTLVTVLGGGAALRVVEPGLHLTLTDASWWALATATTVGYGDIIPETGWGRTIGACVMVVGIGFVALLTAAMARQFLVPTTDELRKDEDETLMLLRDLSVRIEQIERKLGQRSKP